MNTVKRFSLTLPTPARLAPDKNAMQPAPRPDLPTLNEVLARFAPLPRSALFLGLAADGLPILLNLLDPRPGPILIAGDPACGKTRLLQTLASSVELVHSSSPISYTVITTDAPAWNVLRRSSSCEDILASGTPELAARLRSIVAWAHSAQEDARSKLLLIDDLEPLLGEAEIQPDLRWLFFRGPARRVWPVVTINSATAASDSFRPWLGSFRTRLFGHMDEDPRAQILSGSSAITFKNLIPGSQFAMREEGGWLSFWIPAFS